MSTTNNNTASFTVENLVAKYREYISKHCSYSGNACEGNNGKMIDVFAPKSPDANADEQLLVTLYSCVAGSEADKNVLTALSGYAEKYHKEALTEEEFAFLCNNFKELVAYEFSHRTEWGWKSAYKSDEDIEYLPHRSHHTHTRNARTSLQFEIIKLLPKPEVGQTIFITDSGYCDVAMLFPECIIKGYTTHNHFDDDNETWALGQIRLYAAGIKSEILPTQKNGLTPEYMSDVDYAIWGMSRYSSFSFYEGVEMLLQHMKPNGKIFISMERNDAAGGGKTLQLRKKLVEGHLVDSIFSFEEEDEFLNISRKTIFISASKSTHHTVRMQMIPGDILEIPSDILDYEILWPSYYAAPKPNTGIPLSSIVSFVSLDRELDNGWNKAYSVHQKDGEIVFYEKIKKILVAAPADMAEDFKDANLCEANMKLAGDPFFEKWAGWIVWLDQPCVLLYGRGEKYLAGYVKELPENGMATMITIACLVPQKKLDVRYVAALLLSPEVKNQIITICEGEVNDTTIPIIMDKVIIPNYDDKERLTFLADASDDAIRKIRQEMVDSIEKKITVLKADYINNVRMRKHDMSPHLLQVKSAEKLMRHYIETTTDIVELKKQLLPQVDYVDKALAVISEIVEHLSDEEKFGVTEIVNIDKLLEDIELNHHDNDGITIKYDCDRGSFRKTGLAIPNMIEEWEKSEKQGVSPEDFIRKGYFNSSIPNMIKDWENAKGERVKFVDFIKSQENQFKENLPLYAEIAPIDFQRMVTNIFENARRHAFTDPSREDYFIGIDLSLNDKADMYQIDFSNNGNPLPEGMTKERYGIRGEKVGATAGTGSGGYIIKSIVNHYGGDYDVFTKEGITTIRIYLPIASKV